MKMLMIMIFAAILLLAPGCTQTSQYSQNMPTMSPPSAQNTDQGPTRNPGSLFDAGNANYLFSDNRARRVGDLVIVNIVEVSSGTQSANTKTERKTENDYTVTNLFRKQDTGIDPVGGSNIFGFWGPVGTTDLLNTTSENSFEGKGSTDRAATVTATVGARVISILPGGLMQVEGARQVRVNDETQIMVVRGLVRPRDIGPGNTISTNQMANMEIEYYGKGVLADKQKAGWLMRMMDNLWPW